MKKNTLVDWSEQTLYVGIDLHKKKWVATVRTDELVLKTFATDGKKESFVKAVLRNWPGARIKAVYEAGYFGYHIAAYLNGHGIETMIASPQRIPKEPGYFVKTDKIDSRKLAEFLSKGLLRGIWQWDTETLQDRGLVRKRGQMVKRRVQIQLQIKADLAFYGIEIKTTKWGYWSKRYIAQLKQIGKECSHDYYGTVFRMMIEEYEQLRIRIREVTKLIIQLSKTDKYRENVALLRRIPGISVLSAMILLTEIGNISRFPSEEKFVSYIGFTPSEYSSGERVRKGSLTGMGNGTLRKMFIEIAWIAVRKDPALLEKFDRVRKGKSKTKAIVAVARSMANRVRRVVITGEPYVIGVVA